MFTFLSYSGFFPNLHLISHSGKNNRMDIEIHW